MPKKLTLEDHLTGQQLRRRYLSCQHSQEKKRWQGLTLIAEGGVAAQMAKELGMSANWICETVHRYNEGGAAAVKNKSKNEGLKTLTDEQVADVCKIRFHSASSASRARKAGERRRASGL